jgi:phosphatidylinositol alpha-1,6-mannosyltransferase
VVLTLHTIIKHSMKLFNLLLSPTDRYFLKRAVVAQADRVICPDMNMKEYLAAAFGRHDGVVVPYGISLPPHPGPVVQHEIFQRYKSPVRPVILSLGHVNALRNRLDLIRAIPAVREKFPDVLLLIVGDVADRRPVELVRQLGLEGAVVFAGSQPYAHVSVYHSLADITAMWIDQAENGMNSLGVACMEAMLAGKPVLTVSNEDTFGRGVLENGRDIVLVDMHHPGNIERQIIDLFSNPDRIQRIGTAAQALAEERFAWPKVAAQTAGIYSSVLAQARPVAEAERAKLEAVQGNA